MFPKMSNYEMKDEGTFYILLSFVATPAVIIKGQAVEQENSWVIPYLLMMILHLSCMKDHDQCCSCLVRTFGQKHATRSGVWGAGAEPQCKRVYRVCNDREQWFAHSLRTRRLGPVPPCVQPLPVKLNAGNEAKWTPVEVGRSDSEKWGEYGGKQEACQLEVCLEKGY